MFDCGLRSSRRQQPDPMGPDRFRRVVLAPKRSDGFVTVRTSSSASTQPSAMWRTEVAGSDPESGSCLKPVSSRKCHLSRNYMSRSSFSGLLDGRAPGPRLEQVRWDRLSRVGRRGRRLSVVVLDAPFVMPVDVHEVALESQGQRDVVGDRRVDLGELRHLDVRAAAMRGEVRCERRDRLGAVGSV